LSPKTKYIYSQETKEFEEHKLPFRSKLLRLFGILSALIASSVIIVAIAFKFIGSPKEKRMQAQLEHLQEEYDDLSDKIDASQEELSLLQKRDNEVYRVIFEADPLPSNISDGFNSANTLAIEEALASYGNDKLLKNIENKIEQIDERIKKQSASYDEILKIAGNKEELLLKIPSIQPVSNKSLKRIASGFGYRVDPIYKIGKFHGGLDFAAPQGTPVYATGNATVEVSEYSRGGYGNRIWLNHGAGYRTHYAHLVKRKVKKGQKVKRGDVIAWVGSTGKSTGPHLHYEVERKGELIDPIHFFFNDLGPGDYERMVKISRGGNQSFD